MTSLERREIQKEFGQVHRDGNWIHLEKFGTKAPEAVASLLWEYASQPYPHLVVQQLGVDESEEGKGFASQLLSEFEAMCREKRLPGVVYDGIDEDEHPFAKGMYARRRGWIAIPNTKETVGNQGYRFDVLDDD